jgi:hypothetical protein
MTKDDRIEAFNSAPIEKDFSYEKEYTYKENKICVGNNPKLKKAFIIIKR